MPKNVTVEKIEVQTKDAVKNLALLAGEFDKVNESSQDLDDQLEEANEEIEKTGTEASKTATKVSELPGPLGRTGSQVEVVSSAFKKLLANPIVLFLTAIVGVLGLLVKAFTSTKEGGEKVQQVTAGFSAALDVLRDVAVVVGKALVDIFTNPKESIASLWEFIKNNLIARFQGLIDSAKAVGKILKSAFDLDFEGVKEGAKEFGAALVQVGTGFKPEEIADGLGRIRDGLKGIVEEIKTEAILAANLTGELQKIIDLQRELGVLRAEQNRDLAQQKLIAEDINANINDRVSALVTVIDAEKKLLDQELEALRERLRIESELAALSDSDEETLQRLADLRIQIAQTEQASLGARLESENKLRMLLKERTDQELADAQMLQEEALADIDELIAAEEKYAADSIAISVKKNQTELKVDKLTGAQKTEVAEGVLSAAQGLAKEGSVAYKGIAAAQGLMDTYRSAITSYTSLSSIPIVGPVLGAAAAAAAVIAGLSNVRKILSTDPEKGSGGGSPSVPATAPVPTFESRVSEQDVSGGNVTATLDPNAEPVKAYVVSTEVTTQQQLDKRIEDNAGLN